MKLNRLIITGFAALLPIAASATNQVIPVAGTIAGANGSRWQTEVTFHNSTSREAQVVMTFRDAEGVAVPSTLRVPARRTMTVQDIVKTLFNHDSAIGAIEIADTDSDPRNLAITARTINVSANGEFGQDIPSVALVDAAQTGSVTALTGPAIATKARFNFGLYVASDATVRWELIRADGTVAASKDMSYRASTQHQYNNGVVSLLSAVAQDNDVIHASLTKGTAVFYGSLVDQQTGDPSFVPGVITKVDPTIRLVGIDRDLNGTVDVADANGDGVLDNAVDAYTLGFPNYFRIVAEADGTSALSFEIIDAPADVRLIDIDNNGTILLAPSPALKGTTAEIKVRVTADGKVTILTFPVKFL
jgi:hypothetical protein